MRPSGADVHPGTGSDSAVTAAITAPSRSSALVCSWSSRRMSSAIASPRGASAGSTQVVSESALTAIGSVPGPLLRAELTGGGLGQRLDLAGQPQDGLARVRDPDRLRAHEQHAPGGDLERADALADRRRGDVQHARRRLEGALRHRRGQRPQLGEVEIHQQQC